MDVGCEPRLAEHTQHACQEKQHWPLLFVYVPPIVLLYVVCAVLCVCAMLLSMPISMLKHGHLFAFLFAHRIAFVSECMHIWLCSMERSYLLEERGGRWVVWSAGTSKPLWLADWLPGSPVD